MKDFVSGRTAGVAALATTSIAWGVLVGLLGRPVTDPWSVGVMGLAGFWAALWVGFRSTQSLRQIIHDADNGPRLATVPRTVGAPPTHS